MMMKTTVLVVCFGLALASNGWAQEQADAPLPDEPAAAPAAQTPSTGTTTTTTTSTASTAPNFVNLSGFSNDYQVGTGDLLDIQVVGNTDLNQVLRVTSTGEVSYPMLGMIPVADKTVFEIESIIADVLRTKGLMKEPDVLVSVREYQAKPIYVSGAVVNPGQFVMSQDLTAVDAVLLAGGLMFNAADEGLIHRRTAEGLQTIKVDLKPLKEGRFLESAPGLKRGDVLVVPDQQMTAFYVVGAVIDPRNFFYRPQRPLTASEAISWAGGPTQTAKLGDGLLVRYDANGERIEKQVNYGAILRGEAPDFAIQPNDIIFIPGSFVKTVSQGLVMLADSMVMQASFRIGRTYQLPDAEDAMRDRQRAVEQMGGR